MNGDTQLQIPMFLLFGRLNSEISQMELKLLLIIIWLQVKANGEYNLD